MRAALCFVDGIWGLLAKPLEINGVTVTCPKALVGTLGGSGPLDGDELAELAAHLNHRLEPA